MTGVWLDITCTGKVSKILSHKSSFNMPCGDNFEMVLMLIPMQSLLEEEKKKNHANQSKLFGGLSWFKMVSKPDQACV